MSIYCLIENFCISDVVCTLPSWLNQAETEASTAHSSPALLPLVAIIWHWLEQSTPVLSDRHEGRIKQRMCSRESVFKTRFVCCLLVRRGATCSASLVHVLTKWSLDTFKGTWWELCVFMKVNKLWNPHRGSRCFCLIVNIRTFLSF